MAKISSYRRLMEQDFPDDAELIKKLGITVNASFEELYSALNNRLTVKENLSATMLEFTVSVNASGVPNNKTTFKLQNGQTTVEGLIVIDAYGTNDPTLLPTAGIFVHFARNENNINIQNIKGLPANVPFTVKVIVLG